MTDTATSLPPEITGGDDGSARVLSKPHLRGCARSWRELTFLLGADLHRYAGRRGVGAFMRHFFTTPGYTYTVWMRVCGWAKAGRLSRYLLYPFLKFILLQCRYRYGIVIPEYTVIGPGLFINRFGGIYVNGDAVIGANVNLTHGVVLGQSNRGKSMGSPVIGPRVFLATGAKIIGRVHVREGAVVGANSVVTRDVPANAVVGGIPAKVISQQGSEGYVNRTIDDCGWTANRSESGY